MDNNESPSKSAGNEKTSSASPPTPTESGVLAETARTVGITAGVGVATGVAVPVAATAALGAAGFTTAGVAAGSAAAGIQAGMGTVAAGSWFAAAQSAGALGGFAILGPVGIIAGIVGGVVTAAVLINKKRKKKKRNPLEEHNLVDEDNPDDDDEDDISPGTSQKIATLNSNIGQ